MDKERADRKALEKERAKLIRNDNEVEDVDEDNEPWMRKSLHGRCADMARAMHVNTAQAVNISCVEEVHC